MKYLLLNFPMASRRQTINGIGLRLVSVSLDRWCSPPARNDLFISPPPLFVFSYSRSYSEHESNYLLICPVGEAKEIIRWWSPIAWIDWEWLHQYLNCLLLLLLFCLLLLLSGFWCSYIWYREMLEHIQAELMNIGSRTIGYYILGCPIFVCFLSLSLLLSLLRSLFVSFLSSSLSLVVYVKSKRNVSWVLLVVGKWVDFECAWSLLGGAGVLASPFQAMHGLASPLTAAYGSAPVGGRHRLPFLIRLFESSSSFFFLI